MRNADRQRGFTLIEMMVVIALIGILIGGVFRLLGLSGENAKEAETVERLQRLENALSGFYAEYGMYPPVLRHGSPDPFKKDKNVGSGSDGFSHENARRAARCQPVGFEFPTPRSLDEHTIMSFNGKAYPVNLNPQSFSSTKTEWEDVKLFKFGVMSFLLPRLMVIGDFSPNGKSESRPDEDFFSYKQWTQFNASSNKAYAVQLKNEMVCARWAPNFQNIVYGGKSIFGVNMAQRDRDYVRYAPIKEENYGEDAYTGGGGNRHVLAIMTIVDGWDKELYYYSAPPYQSYRVWSSGPNGKTFPPWVSLSSLTPQQRKEVNEWIKDDIARTRK